MSSISRCVQPLKKSTALSRALFSAASSSFMGVQRSRGGTLRIASPRTTAEELMATDVAGAGLPWIEEVRQSFELRPFTEFHHRELPELITRHGHLVAADVRGAPTVAFRVEDGTTFSWVAADPVQVVEGDTDATTLIELSEAAFSDFLHELVTANGAVRTGRARVVRGSLDEWQRWEPAIQALCFGRPIYDSSVWETLVDRDGHKLDLARSFEVDDP